MKLVSKKIIISVLMVLTLAFGCISPAFAESADSDAEVFEAVDTDVTISTDADASINSTTIYNAQLSYTYTTVVTGSTTLGKTIKVTNSAESYAGVLVRVLNSSHTTVVSPVAVPVDSTYSLKIPMGTGTYYVQVRAIAGTDLSKKYYITFS